MSAGTPFNARNGLTVGTNAVNVVDTAGNVTAPTVTATQFVGSGAGLTGTAPSLTVGNATNATQLGGVAAASYALAATAAPVASPTFTGTTTVTGPLMPAALGQDIGSAALPFKNIYVDDAHLAASTLYLNGSPVLSTQGETGNIQVTADLNQTIVISTTGSGQTQIISEDGVQISTSKANANVLIETTGAGSDCTISALGSGGNAIISGALQVQLNAPTTNVSGNLNVTGNTIFSGNTTFNGTNTSVNTQSVLVTDNIMKLNNGEVGNGVTAGTAGLRIDRGAAPDQQLIWSEAGNAWKAGPLGAEICLATQAWVGSQGFLTTGAVGPTGAMGATGNTGAMGATGNTGATGATGINGATGAIGATGPQGIQGVAGATGAIGATGNTGAVGATGNTGLTGNTGAMGASGTNGTNGATGAVGATGATGINGIPGVQGIAGVTGATGINGATGPQGATGINGATGAVGATGSQGIQGIVGATGAVGATGSQGIQGLVGATGSQGIQGLVGPTGSAGLTGATGPQGSTGQGFIIAKVYGSQAALLADTAPTGINPGQFAIISDNNSDNAELFLWNGSTYTYMVDMAGATGIQGPAGNNGATGPQGIQGIVGATGAVGATGNTGVNGATGAQGTTGAVGATGNTILNALTMNNSGTGAASGTTFTGASAQTLSYNTIGAQAALTGTGFVKSAAGVISYDGNTYVVSGGALGTPTSGSLVNCTFPTLNQSTTGNAATVTNASLTNQFNCSGRVVANYNTMGTSGFYGDTGSSTNGPGGGYGSLLVVNNSDTALQIYGGYNLDNLYFRGAYSTLTGFTPWRTVIHSGNIASQTVATAGTCTGNAATATNALQLGGVVAANYIQTGTNANINAQYLLINNITWQGTFNGSPSASSPTYVWGNNGLSGTQQLFNTANLNVSYANSAGSCSGAAGSAPVLTGPASVNGSDGWFRSTGAAGWYNSTYATGIYSTGAGSVSTYNGATFTASKVYNAVYNDIADFLELEEELETIEFGRVYVRTQDGKTQISESVAEKGALGIASDTYGYGLGKKDLGNRELPIAIGGFVLAFCDTEYESGDALTSGPDGVLTLMPMDMKALYPERILATFLKAPEEALWNGIEVNGRYLVKVV